jgi:ribosome-associated protein
MRSRFSGFGPVSNEFEGEASGPSKSQAKREMKALQDLGEDLVGFGAQQLAALQLPTALSDAIDQYRRTKTHEGRRRQMQFIGKLMRRVDAEPIRQAVDAQRAGKSLDAAALHAAERWRADLLVDDEALQRWAAAHPQSDLQRLRSLIRSARKDAVDAAARAAANQPVVASRAARELFRAVRDSLDTHPERDESDPPQP